MINKISQYRRREGLTIKQLSEATGISLSYVGALDNNTAMSLPSIQKAYIIAKVLDCTVYDLWPDEVEVEVTTRTLIYRSVKK